jgi:DNA-directed RNA polymerase subunit L
MIVSDIEIKSYKPTINDPKYAHLLPKLVPEHIRFVLSNTDNAFSNALRRTISSEVPVLAMYVEQENIVSTDEFNIAAVISSRFKMVPLVQSCPHDAVFTLSAENTTMETRDVKSGEIKLNGKGNLKWFDNNITMFTLMPGKRATITNIRVGTFRAIDKGDGACVVAVNAASVVLDVVPINHYNVDEAGEPIGVPSREAYPRKYAISYTTNGTMPPLDIARMACDNIISRINHCKTIPVQTSGDNHILYIVGETHTIGNLLMRAILTNFPDIPSVVYKRVYTEIACIVDVTYNGDINDVFETATDYIIESFKQIKDGLIEP